MQSRGPKIKSRRPKKPNKTFIFSPAWKKDGPRGLTIIRKGGGKQRGPRIKTKDISRPNETGQPKGPGYKARRPTWAQLAG